MATTKQIAVANSTSRSGSAIGHKAITPKMVRKYVDLKNGKRTMTILDFGAGKTADHARKFVEDGYNCLAHEFGDNIDPRYHCELSMLNTYDVVYASNVLNVQQSYSMVVEMLDQVKHVMKPTSVFIANFPLKPRKMDITAEDMGEWLRLAFKHVVVVGGNNQAPIFLAFGCYHQHHLGEIAWQKKW